MPIPQSEINAWAAVFAEELFNTPAPFYGINEYDVPVENWDAYKVNLHEQYKYVQLVGGQHHFWAVRDYGSFKRVIWINYYPEGAKQPENAADTEKIATGGMQSVADGHQLITRYNWFTATEVSDSSDALF